LRSRILVSQWKKTWQLVPDASVYDEVCYHQYTFEAAQYYTIVAGSFPLETPKGLNLMHNGCTNTAPMFNFRLFLYHLISVVAQLVHFNCHLKRQPIAAFLQIDLAQRLEALQALDQGVAVDEEALRCLGEITGAL